MNHPVETDAGPLVAAIDVAMIAVAGGKIMLKDEASGRQWLVALQPYCLSSHAVSCAHHAQVMGLDPVAGAAAHKPVVDVSWLDALAFCNALSRLAGLQACYRPDGEGGMLCDWQADGYRLPSEAEWEYACRAGTNEVRHGALDEIAWHRGNAGGELHAMGTRAPNAWGFHDMIGNVWEWCWDIYDARVYGPYRVFRGGGWNDTERACRASCRRKSHPAFHIDDLGFRVARSLPQH